MTFEELSNIVGWSFAPWETDYYLLRFNEPTSMTKVSELISRNIDHESMAEVPFNSGVHIPRNNPNVAYVAVSKGIAIPSEEGVVIESITDVPTESSPIEGDA